MKNLFKTHNFLIGGILLAGLLIISSCEKEKEHYLELPSGRHLARTDECLTSMDNLYFSSTEDPGIGNFLLSMQDDYGSASPYINVHLLAQCPDFRIVYDEIGNYGSHFLAVRDDTAGIYLWWDHWLDFVTVKEGWNGEEQFLKVESKLGILYKNFRKYILMP